MIKYFLCFLLTIASPIPLFASNICERNDLQEFLRDERNRLSFKNRGGLLWGGVCWWHSRFLRNAAYLTTFDPYSTRPHRKVILKKVKNEGESDFREVYLAAPGSVQDLLEKIKRGREVVVIPGFNDLHEFSLAYQSDIQKILYHWQLEDGIVRQRWISGLSGTHRIRPQLLSTMMDDLYQKVSQGKVVYQKLQIKGITAHSWLVTGMEKLHEGYRLEVIDSNVFNLEYYIFKHGDDSFFHKEYKNFVPYTENIVEEEKLMKVRLKYCHSSKTSRRY